MPLIIIAVSKYFAFQASTIDLQVLLRTQNYTNVFGSLYLEVRKSNSLEILHCSTLFNLFNRKTANSRTDIIIR